MGLLQRSNLSVNLLILLFLVFASQIVQFDLNNLPAFCMPKMNPIQGQAQFFWILATPPPKLRLISSAQSFLKAFICVAGAEVVGWLVRGHIFSANVSRQVSLAGGEK